MSTSYKSLFPSSPSPVESFSYPDTHGISAPIAPAAQKDSNDELGELLLKAHAEGVREGEEKERARLKELVEKEQARITETVLCFQTSVAEYFSRTELEVVQLALAIAAKILRREAQTDPALVAKLAESILSELHQNTSVKIRVSPGQAEAWREEFAAHQDGKTTLEVVADSSVQENSCILETDLGSTDIGIDAQLSELEGGMHDLLAESPEPR
jgi:flagellar assembly protein FliH